MAIADINKEGQTLKPIDVKLDNDERVFRRELLREIDHAMDVLDLRIKGLHDMMAQHDAMLQVANDKAQETLNERLSKMNEFREQQKDIISKFATIVSLDALASRVDLNVHTATERFDRATVTMTDKIVSLKTACDEKMAEMVIHADEKREMLSKMIQENFKSMQEKGDANIKNEVMRFEAVDKQMIVLINANADISNKGISDNSKRIGELFDDKNKQQGSMTVIKYILSAAITILIGLILFLITNSLKK